MSDSDGVVQGSDVSDGIAALGGVGEVAAFRDAAHLAADDYFDYHFPTGTENERNAFRHAFVSGRFAMETGDDFAAFLGLAHEWGTDLKTFGWNRSGNGNDRNADLWNNNEGIVQADGATSPADLAQRIATAMANGDLIVDLDTDTRVFTFDPSIEEDALDEAEGITATPVETPDDGQSAPPIPERKPDTPFVEAVESAVGTAENQASPLVFDLDDSGTIELLSLGSSETYWDIDQDGFAEASGWVTGGDGLLALDLNDNGRIDDNSELFGTVDTDGFSILATYDSNADRLIDAQDAVWDELIIWVDANENGYSESVELYSMNDLDIISIDINATAVSQTNQGHSVTHTSTFTVDTGGGTDTRIVHDVWFQYDDVNTTFVTDFTPDIRVAFLPTLRGYGTLPDLFISMSLDNNGAGNLLDLVKGFKYAEIDELFVDDGTTFEDVGEIMYRWAGVDGLTGDERGEYIDSREVEFLEAMMGQDYLQRGWMTDPAYWAAQDLKEAFYIAQQNIFARLAAQSAGGDLFTGDFYYDAFADEFVGITGLDTGVLDDLETLAGTQTNKDVFWQGVVRMIEHVVGIENLSGGDETALDDAIYDSDNSLDLAQIVDSLDWSAPTGSTYNGTSGNDPLTGGTGADELNGLAGDDTINGGLGADAIEGGADDDTMNGQSGADIIYGGTGEDVYLYEAGHGDDVYEEDSTGGGNTNDRIEFGAGIDSGDLTITRVSNTDLLIEIDNGVVTGSITIQSQFNYSAGGGHVEWIEFDDTSTIDLASLGFTLTGTSGNDTLFGAHDNQSTGADTIYGGAGNDTIYGYAPNETDNQANTLYGDDGNDAIYGGAGVDTIYGGDGDDSITANGGNDDITTGAGDDSVIGGSGDDTYRYVSGIDVYADASGTDTLRLDSVWNGVTPQYLRIGNDLQIYFDADDNITVTGFFTGTNKIETMIYANTTSVDLTTVSTVTQGTSGNDNLGGGTGNDVLYGFGGNDTLTGNNGNDSLYGGTGNDYLYGSNNDDYLDGGAGDDQLSGSSGNDHLFYSSGHDSTVETTGTDILELATGWTWGDLSFERHVANVSNLTIAINGSNSVTLLSMFSSSTQVETLRLNDGTGDVNLLNLHYTTYGDGSGNTIGGITNSNFSGGAVNDTIYGYGGNDTIVGYDGNDTIYGGDGNDGLTGSDGNDWLEGQGGDDTLTGNAGNDTYVYSGGLDTATDTGGTDTIWITGGITINDISLSNVSTYNTKITVTASTDELTVTNLRHGTSSNHIETIMFDDGFYASNLPSYQTTWLFGTSGNDLSAGSGSSNTQRGLAGDDTMDGNGGDDFIHGGADDDTIEGGDGNDVLHGGTDDDVLYGEGGLDILFGGTGEDTFVFQAASAFSNIDEIKDFDTAEDDAINIADLLVGYNATTDAIADFVSFVNDGANSKMYVDRDGTAGSYSSAQITLIHGVTNLDAEDLETGGYLIAA